MRRKLAFICGLTIGYVLGTRAGKERYQQIKKGANVVWESSPVIKCRQTVRGFVGERISNAQDYVVGKGKQVLYAVTNPKSEDES